MMSVLEYKFNTALHRSSDLSATICTHLLTNSTSVGVAEAWEMAVVGEEAVINISERYIVSF